jgi:Fe-S-cluster containining protein
MIPLEQLPKRAKEQEKTHKKLLEKSKPKFFQTHLERVHEEVFEQVDCLQCANCCKTISPRFKTPDVVRIAKKLKMKESAFIERYLRVDEDGDLVTKTSPCPFLGSDNYCSIYEVRPGDCSNYPYTDSDVFYKRPRTTLANAAVCPAAFLALERMQELLESKP